MGRDFYLDAADERKRRNEKYEDGERRNDEEKRGRHWKKERECYLSACHGPPCITSLRCFGTDDIVGLGGELALGMMSLITNQRTRRPV